MDLNEYLNLETFRIKKRRRVNAKTKTSTNNFCYLTKGVTLNKHQYGIARWSKNLIPAYGADSGFDRIDDSGGARRGAVGLVKSRKKIVANDENYALAA